MWGQRWPHFYYSIAPLWASYTVLMLGLCLKLTIQITLYGNECRYEIINSELVISAETVEKPKLQDFKIYNYLILLHTKFEKMPKLGFFDSLAMYDRNFKAKIFTDITMPAKLFVAQILAR